MNIALVYILISVILGAIGQIMLKNGLNAMGMLTLNVASLGGTLWRLVTNPFVFFGLVVYVTGTVFWLAALSRVDLSYAYPFASLSYVVMLLAAFLIFKENVSLLRIIGTLVVGLGVLIISRS